jgi:hypothetical protein
MISADSQWWSGDEVAGGVGIAIEREGDIEPDKCSD